MSKTLADAKVGDTVTLTGIVRSNAHDDKDHLIYIDFPGCSYAKGITPGTHVDQIIPKPWEPKVGDKVRYQSSANQEPSTRAYTVEAIIRDSLCVSYKGADDLDYFLNFKKAYAICAD